MKKVLYSVEHHNFGLMSNEDWSYTKWDIYEDEIIMNKYYGDSDKGIESKFKIGKLKLWRINKLFSKTNDIYTRIDACDGDAWKFSKLVDDKLVVIRDLDYIYGIKEFERIAKLLEKYDDKEIYKCDCAIFGVKE